MEKYKNIRAINRGLEVLAAVGQEPGASVGRISQMVSVHRTTVYRILETLETAGFVRRSLGDDTYRLTHKTRALSAGIEDDTHIVDVAARFLAELTDELEWPASVATPSHHAMVIRETTHGRSPLFVHRVRIGMQSPVLTTAMGRAYLAFCSAGECERRIDEIAASDGLESRYARDSQYVEKVITRTRERGFGFSYGDCRRNLGSVAVPIRHHGEVRACINTVFFRSAVDADVAIKTFLPAVTRAAAMIERSLARNGG